MINAPAAATRTFEQVGRLIATTGRAQRRLRSGRLLLIALAGVGAADCLLPLPAWARGILMVAFLGFLAREAAASMAKTDWNEPGEAALARRIEDRLPELDNALIHSVQFAPILAFYPEHPGADQTRLEIGRAEALAVDVDPDRVVSRRPVRRERARLAWTVGIVALSLLIFPRAFRFEAPRLFLFWADYPPYSLTDFDFVPDTGHVRAGESLTITVRASGQQPRRLDLVVGADGSEQRTLPTTEIAPGRFSATLDTIDRQTWLYADADTGRSRQHWILVDPTPHVRRLVVSLHPPAWTRAPDETRDLKPTDTIEARADTRLIFAVEADSPLASASLTVSGDNGSTLPLTIPSGDPSMAEGGFDVENGGDFRISLQGASGGTAASAFVGRTSVTRDGKPRVRIVRPAANTMTRATTLVPIEIEADADAGISRLELHRILNRGQDAIDSLPPPAAGATRLTHIDLKSMHVRPGDVIEYFATAFDANPKAMQNAESSRYWVQVVSDADYALAMRRQRGPAQMIAQYRARIEAVKTLAAAQGAYAAEWEDILREERSGSKDSKQHVPSESQEGIEAGAEQAESDLRELASQPPQYTIDRGLAAKMQALAEAVHRARQSMATSERSSSTQAVTHFARRASDELRDGLHRAAEGADRALNTLEKTLPLYLDFERIGALAERELHVAQGAHDAERSQVTGRMPAFTLSRLASLSAEQTAIRSRLDALQSDLLRHAEAAQFAAPDGARTARKAVDRVKKERLLEQMRQIADLFDYRDAIDGAGIADQVHAALVNLLQQSKQGKRETASALETQSRRNLAAGAQNTLEKMSRRPDAGNTDSGSPPPGKSGNEKAPQPGTRPNFASGESQDRGEQPTAAGLTTSRSGAHSAPVGNGNARIAPIPTLAPPSSGWTNRYGTAKPGAVPVPAGRYPAEYRRLVQDYFSAVAGSR